MYSKIKELSVHCNSAQVKLIPSVFILNNMLDLGDVASTQEVHTLGFDRSSYSAHVLTYGRQPPRTSLKDLCSSEIIQKKA